MSSSHIYQLIRWALRTKKVHSKQMIWFNHESALVYFALHILKLKWFLFIFCMTWELKLSAITRAMMYTEMIADVGSSPAVRRPPRRCPTSFFLELSLHSQSWAKISQETTDDSINAQTFPKGSSMTNSRRGTICHLCPTWHHQWNESSFFILIISSSDRRTTCPLRFHSCCPVHAGISSQKKDESL